MFTITQQRISNIDYCYCGQCYSYGAPCKYR